LNAGSLFVPAATIRVFGRLLEAQPKSAACQQVQAENHVAGGGIDGFRRKVNAMRISPDVYASYLAL
jgi:hypothetical protein